MLLPASNYYEDRPVRHCAQGDFYENVPCTFANGTGQQPDRGARKRPRSFFGTDDDKADYATQTYPHRAIVVVCNYTCGFIAQPPGTEGYSHSFRQVAPVVPLTSLIDKKGGMQPTEARRLKSSGFLSGLLYVPRPPGCDSVTEDDGEFTADDYAVCLYRMTTVDQSLLDQRARIAQMTSQAQGLLISGLIALMSPNFFDPNDLESPDMSSSWPAG